MKIYFELPIVPVAKERARVKRFGVFTPARTREFQTQVHLLSRKYAPKELFKKPLSLECFFYLSKPKKPKFKYPGVRPDIDNYVKAIMDSLNGLFWKDDSLVVILKTEKHYTTASPSIVVIIEELE